MVGAAYRLREHGDRGSTREERHTIHWDLGSLAGMDRVEHGQARARRETRRTGPWERVFGVSCLPGLPGLPAFLFLSYHHHHLHSRGN